MCNSDFVISDNLLYDNDVLDIHDNGWFYGRYVVMDNGEKGDCGLFVKIHNVLLYYVYTDQDNNLFKRQNKNCIKRGKNSYVNAENKLETKDRRCKGIRMRTIEKVIFKNHYVVIGHDGNLETIEVRKVRI